MSHEIKSVGEDVIISNNVEIKRPELVSIGNHVAIDSFFVCTTQLKLGNYIHISPQVGVIGGKTGLLEMEDYTFISLGCNIICGGEKFHGDGIVCPFLPNKYRDTLVIKPIKIKKFAGVCAGSTILPGAIISEGSVIGANSLVLADTITEPWTIYAGSPIRPIRKRKKDKIIKYAGEIESETECVNTN